MKNNSGKFGMRPNGFPFTNEYIKRRERWIRYCGVAYNVHKLDKGLSNLHTYLALCPLVYEAIG